MTRPTRTRNALSATGLVGGLLLALVLVGAWHLTQGTSGLGVGDLLSGDHGDIITGSRLPRLLAGVAVGVALGVAGMLLQSVTRNPLASPDTLAVTAGAYVTLCAVAAFGVSVPLWASSLVAFTGGLVAAAVVLGLAGAWGAASASSTATTRLILAGSAIAMALDAVSGMLLILFKEGTTGLFAWGSGSLAQLSIDASQRAVPVIAVVILLMLLLSRRLDALALSDDDTATTLGVPVRSTRLFALLGAVLLTSTAVTLAGPLAFVGLGAPVVTRLLASKVPALHNHLVSLPVSGLLGALLVLLSDAGLRGLLGAAGATSVPTGIPTGLLGGVLIVVLALRLRDAGSSRGAANGAGRTGTQVRSRTRFPVVVAVSVALLITTVVVGVLAGSLWLRTGDILLWLQGTAPRLIDGALDDRVPRVLAAVTAGAALGLSGWAVQGTVRNPLADPGLLGITAGAGLGAVAVVTLAPDQGRSTLVVAAVVTGLLTFAVIAVLSGRGGLSPDRFVLVGIGTGYALSSLTTYLLLRSDPWNTPRIFTWLSGTTYGRGFSDVLPVAVVLVVALPLLWSMHRDLDLLAVDDDTPRILGLRPGRTRLVLLSTAAVLAAVAVVAVGTVGFVGLVAPHLARSLVGARHVRVIPVSVLLGAVLVGVADILGRTLIAPSQIPVGLMIALIGAPYFVWLLRRG
ncbi:iron ABC transporter permease [uncultured Corynebacterium sp.]|uniref:iron ABC transporter permease n=1 Tax=uncultured Corynebacterium sp. TaxID=159447 RepID=UPI0025EA4DE7|nr:iron ABC transporter permease [uncultured Corynebacterium sp.]